MTNTRRLSQSKQWQKKLAILYNIGKMEWRTDVKIRGQGLIDERNQTNEEMKTNFTRLMECRVKL